MNLSFRAVRAIVTTLLVVGVLVWIGIRSLMGFSSHNSANSAQTAQESSQPMALCSNADTRLKDAPAYDSSSSQPIALYARASDEAGVHYKGIYVLGTAPAGTGLYDAYKSVGKNLTETNAKKETPVLVACINRSNEQKTSQTCDYEQNKSIAIYDASYELTIYEARSREVIKTTKITSQPNYVCLSFSTYDGTGFYKQWNTAEVAAALYPFTAK